MRRYMIAASIAALAIGSGAEAATVCKQDSTGRTVATVVGAGIGALLGNVIDGGRHRTAGTVVGGVAGGVAANQLAKSDSRCEVAYGYYDESGRWHANRIERGRARGYYDRDNRWVEGPPTGYYDSNNRWVSFEVDSEAAGYYDRDGRWVPIGVSGYYAADGQWVQANSPGYYQNGRWVSGPAYGRYDASGRWIADRNYGEPRGYWTAQIQPGYYDERGRWVRGETTGYYDARGRWIATRPGPAGNVAYNSRDVRVREARIEERIQRMRTRGMLSASEARRARNELASIRRDESRMRYSGGRFTANEENVIHQRLDNLGATLRAERDDGDSWAG